MPIPVIEDWTEANSGGASATSLTLTLPTGVQAGDLLFLFVASDDSTNTAQFSINDTNEPGWTKKQETGNTTTRCHLAMFWRIATGDADDQDVTVDHLSSDELLGWYFRISNVSATDPLGPQNINTDGNQTNHTIPTAVSDQPNTLGICALSFDGGDGAPFGGNDLGDWSELDEQTSGTTGNDCCGVILTRTRATAGTYGGVPTPTITSSVSDGSVRFIQIFNSQLGSSPPKTFLQRPNIRHMVNR